MKGIQHVGIDPGIATDIKTAMIAKGLRKDRYWVAGHFPRFFGEVAANRPDGNLSGVPDDLLDEWAGKVKGWGKLVREHLCNQDGVLAAWYKYNGRALAKLQQDRDRKRPGEGESDGRADDDTPPKPRTPRGGKSGEIPRNRRRHSAENPRKIRDHSTPITDTDTDTSFPDGKEQINTRAPDGASATDPDPPKPAASWPGRLAQVWTEHVGTVNPGRLGKALKPFVERHGEELVAKAIRHYGDTLLEEDRMRFASPEDFARTGRQWVDDVTPIGERPLYFPPPGER